MKAISKKIENIELVKVQNTYGAGNKPSYFYNFYLEDIDEPLLVSNVDKPVTHDLIGKEIKYKLNKDNEVIDFDIQ
jgi:hypothetical protein